MKLVVDGDGPQAWPGLFVYGGALDQGALSLRRSIPEQSEAYAVKAVGGWGQAHQAVWGDLLHLI